MRQMTQEEFDAECDMAFGNLFDNMLTMLASLQIQAIEVLENTKWLRRAVGEDK